MDTQLPKKYLQFSRVLLSRLHYEVYRNKRNEGMSVEDMRKADFPEVDAYESEYQSDSLKLKPLT